jgi:hypothetical protein
MISHLQEYDPLEKRFLMERAMDLYIQFRIVQENRRDDDEAFIGACTQFWHTGGVPESEKRAIRDEFLIPFDVFVERTPRGYIGFNGAPIIHSNLHCTLTAVISLILAPFFLSVSRLGSSTQQAKRKQRIVDWTRLTNEQRAAFIPHPGLSEMMKTAHALFVRESVPARARMLLDGYPKGKGGKPEKGAAGKAREEAITQLEAEVVNLSPERQDQLLLKIWNRRKTTFKKSVATVTKGLESELLLEGPVKANFKRCVDLYVEALTAAEHQVTMVINLALMRAADTADHQQLPELDQVNLSKLYKVFLVAPADGLASGNLVPVWGECLSFRWAYDQMRSRMTFKPFDGHVKLIDYSVRRLLGNVKTTWHRARFLRLLCETVLNPALRQGVLGFLLQEKSKLFKVAYALRGVLIEALNRASGDWRDGAISARLWAVVALD